MKQIELNVVGSWGASRIAQLPGLAIPTNGSTWSRFAQALRLIAGHRPNQIGQRKTPSYGSFSLCVLVEDDNPLARYDR